MQMIFLLIVMVVAVVDVDEVSVIHLHCVHYFFSKWLVLVNMMRLTDVMLHLRFLFIFAFAFILVASVTDVRESVTLHD